MDDSPKTPLQLKCEKLREHFPPDRVGWYTPAGLHTQAGTLVTAVPFPAVQAVRDRLDGVLGPDNWSESYDNPATTGPDGGTYTRCMLRVRFEPGADWVSRVGLSSARELDRAHAEALRAAAESLGVGRYLSLYTQQVEWDGKALKTCPHLPEQALPHGYKRCGRDYAWKLRQLINSACDESAKRGRPLAKSAAANSLAALHGYHVATGQNDVDLSRVENRHAEAIYRRVGDWLAELAKGLTSGPACPLPVPQPKKNPDQNSENKSGSPDGAQAQAKSGEAASPAEAPAVKP